MEEVKDERQSNERPEAAFKKTKFIRQPSSFSFYYLALLMDAFSYKFSVRGLSSMCVYVLLFKSID